MVVYFVYGLLMCSRIHANKSILYIYLIYNRPFGSRAPSIHHPRMFVKSFYSAKFAIAVLSM